MANLLIIALASMLFGALAVHYAHQKPQPKPPRKPDRPTGFFDIKTGGLVDIDPVTRKETPVR